MRTFIKARHETLSALPIKPGLNDRSQAYLQAKCKPFRYFENLRKPETAEWSFIKSLYYFKIKKLVSYFYSIKSF